jgi:superoxide dismutase, Cu-Zn family
MKQAHRTLAYLTLGLGALAGCDRGRAPLEKQTPADRSGAVGSADPAAANGQLPAGTIFQRAEATLEPGPGHKTEGSASLEEITSGVRIQVSVKNAPPNSKLGVHVVNAADCKNVANGVGEELHFNPRNVSHGLPTAGEQHLGDLGNVVTDEGGKGELTILTSGGNLRPQDPRSFLERALVIDDREDRGTPGPAKPAACAVIKAG